MRNTLYSINRSMMIVKYNNTRTKDKQKQQRREVFVHFPSLLSFSKLKRAETTTAKFVAPKEVQRIYMSAIARVLFLKSSSSVSPKTLQRIASSSTTSSSSSTSSLLKRGRARTQTQQTKTPKTRTMASTPKNDEQLNAQEAILKGMQDSTEPTIFDKIVSKEIPATVLYEDNLAMAFKDVNPVAKTHFLVIPKIKAGLSQLSKANEDHKMLLGHCMYVAQMVAKQEKLEKGFRVVINDGVDGCQSVYHLHLHVIGGQQLSWPPGC